MIQHPAVLNAVRDAIFLADIDTGMIVDANRAAEALCGRSLKELRVLHYTQLHSPEVEKLARIGFEKATQTEGVIQHKDGRRIPVETASSHFTAPDGRRMLVGVFRDLTERKQAEAKLQESEKRFRATFFQTPVGIAHTGIDARWLLLNDRFCEILGYSRDELVGKTFLEITHPDDRQASTTAVHQLLSGELPSWETEKRYIRKDGVTIWAKLFLSLVRDEHNQAQYFSAIVEDITQRIQGAQALRQAEHRLMLAQTAAQLGVWYRDWGTHVISVSGEYARLHGMAPDRVTVTQEEWLSSIHLDDRERMVALRRESRERTHSFNAEYRVRWPDGSVHWLLAKGAVLVDNYGQPTGSTGVTMDVTDRKNMEEALRNSEDRFRLATKATNDAIWDLDLKTGTVSWNETYSALYGRPSDKSDSWQWWIESIHPEDRERTVGELRAAIGSGESGWTSEYRFRRVNGEWAYIYDRAYIARDASGNAWRVIGAMQDLTERKHAESALRESEERFRRVFEEGPLGLALVGKDYRFVKVNSALCQMVGYDEAELVQMSFVEITHPDDVHADVELAEQLFKRHIPYYRIQKRYVKKTGEIIWINLTASIILGPDGGPLHGLAMVEDITERKRAQEESFARQKLESVGTLAGGIAHDFNNLLGGVLAQAELALEEYQAGSSPAEELKRIRAGAIRGSEIVRQLMIYAGKESESVELVDVSHVGRDMVELLKVSISKHAVLVADFKPDLPAVRGSIGQIQQIVMNLVTNASEALEDRDGVIRVTTRRVNVDRSEGISKGIAEGDYLQLEVADTGHGMSLETQARVFDPFFTTKSQGRGLGLGVVRGVVRGLGGAIHLESEPGKGTTFQIFLRSTGIMTGGSGPDPTKKESGPAPLATILVVEDDEALRVALTQILRRRGFETLHAANGSDAINLLRANSIKIDMMLLDMTIPGISSHDVAAAAAEARPELKLVLTSAYDEKLVRNAVGANQTCRFIRKPFQIEELVHVLRSNWSVP